MNWKPIETAPKDGTKILVFTIHGDIELSEWYEVPSFHFEEAENGLFRKVIDNGYSGWNSNTPVLWHPLPDLPAKGPDIRPDNGRQKPS